MNICRLCLNGCQDSNSLYDESGQANEFYATTFKYVHPQIVNMEVAKHLTAICSQCWHHISDFEHFLTSILKAQQADMARHLKAMKTEAIVSESVSLPKLEIMDVDSDREFLTDDEDSASAPDCNRGNKDDHLRVDVLLAKWIPVINCTACPESFPYMTLLKNHFRQHHPNSEFFIVCCSRELSTQTQIRDHLLLHNDPNAFTCPLCSSTYATRQSFRHHRRKMHLEYQKFICKVCGAGLGTKAGLKCHYTVVHKMDRLQEQEFQPVESHSTVDHKSDDRTEYICEECGKVFYDEAAHQKHVWHKHKSGINISLESAAVDPDTDGNDDTVNNKTIDTLDDRLAKCMPNINCAVCSETWPKYSLLREHFLQSHPNKEFYIECCNYRLCAPYQIDDHLRLHNDPDAYKCHICHKAYTLKSSLNRHIATQHHKSLKPKMCICQKCGKGFNSKSGLGRHYFVRHPVYHKSRRECTSEQPVDELPTTSSKRAGSVQQAAGSNVWYPCSECGKHFQKYDSLRRHRWHSHKIRTKAASIVMVRENPEGPKK